MKKIFETVADLIGMVAIFGGAYAAMLIIHGMGW